MTYGRRNSRSYKRRSAASVRSITSRRPTASNQKSQILALNKKVNAVAKATRNITYTIFHNYSFSGSIVSPFSSHALVTPTGWQEIFGAPAAGIGGKYTGKSFKFDYEITANTEHSHVSCTVIFASPKNAKVVSECGGANQTLCSPNLHTDYVVLGGKARMNPKRWNIHKVHHIQTAPIVTSTESAGGVFNEYINDTGKGRRSFSMRNPFRCNNRTGSWYTIDDYEITPSQRVHMYVFNNNTSTLEGTPWLSLNMVASGIADGSK